MLIYLPQNNYLLEGTVRENIALGRNGGVGIGEEEIRGAARMAYAEEFIEKLLDGYDTLVSPGGSNLSGGQRQRIAVARAFLKDAPILLMDEPASALDIQSEKMIHKALEKLTEQKVVIMVSHQGKPQESGEWREIRMRIC